MTNSSSDAPHDAAVDAASMDAASMDAASMDAASMDAASMDAASMDAASMDAASMDAATDAGAAPSCGGTSVLSDDFPGTDPGGIWAITASGGAMASETGSQAVVTLPSGQAGPSNGQFQTNRYYDLLGDSVSVEVTTATNAATTASTFFQVVDGSGNYLEISQAHGTLTFDQWVGGTYLSRKTTPYSPSNHLYWRFREDGVSTYWETSSDGTTWVTQTQVATASLFSLQYVQVVIGASTEGGEVGPGPARFGSVNGGRTPVGKWCPVSSITDAFDAAARSPQWYRSFTQSPESVAQVGGQLVFTLSPNDKKDAAYVSSASYDLTGSAVLIQVATTANTATSAQTYLSLDGPGGSIRMREENGQLFATIDVAGTTQIVGSWLYEPTQHAWWRIRESGGTLFWETASDGKAWTVQQQLSPLPFAVDALDLHVGSDTYVAQASPGSSVFDNLNLSPP